MENLTPPKLLFLNGSPQGASGNSARLLARFARVVGSRAEITSLALLKDAAVARAKLEEAQGFVFATGTYWDSWGSPLQKFLEEATGTEATAAWLGKPAAVLVSMHSVGGKEVLSRLQGVLNTLGCQIPPLSGLAYSLAGQLALETGTDFAPDLWQLGDLEVVAHNLLSALTPHPRWNAWPVDREDPHRPWISG